MRTEKELKNRKGVMGAVLNIFVLMLLIIAFTGMTFLFSSQFKEQVKDTTTLTSVTVTNETEAYINSTGYRVDNYDAFNFQGFTVLDANNVTGTITSANWTTTTEGYVYNATPVEWHSVNISYSYLYIKGDDANAYIGINSTEAAGFNTTKFFSMLFL
ncbi:MAG: hypothetical protein ACFFG0_08000, partial [Candidatus Thorarchaeota archaeon]